MLYAQYSITNFYISGNRGKSAQEFAVDMKRCAAYEITSLAKGKVAMEANPAYEQVRLNT